MEKVIIIGVAVFCMLFAGLREPAAAESPCGPNAYIDEVYISGDVRTTVCACWPGYDRVGDTCQLSFTVNYGYETLLIPFGITGEAGLFREKEERRMPVSSERMFYANLVVTGPTGHLTAYLANRMRLRISADTELRLGESLPDYMLTIESLKGRLRLDNNLSSEEIEWVKQKLDKVRAWLRAYTREARYVGMKYFTIGVRGTDFVLEGLKDGTMLVHVLAGEVELEALVSGKRMKAVSGGTVLLPVDGSKPSHVRRSDLHRFDTKWPE